MALAQLVHSLILSCFRGILKEKPSGIFFFITNSILHMLLSLSVRI